MEEKFTGASRELYGAPEGDPSSNGLAGAAVKMRSTICRWSPQAFLLLRDRDPRFRDYLDPRLDEDGAAGDENLG